MTASNACRLPWMSDAIATRMPRVCSVRRSWRLPIALVTAVVVAEAAVFAMRPRDRGPEPLPVEPRAYFSEAQIEKAEAFRSGQLWIYAGQTAIGLGVLLLIVRRPPERGRSLPPSAPPSRRPTPPNRSRNRVDLNDSA